MAGWWQFWKRRGEPRVEERKKVVVVGASGRTGRLVVDELRQRQGFDVVPAVRSLERYGRDRGGRVIAGDICQCTTRDQIADEAPDAVIWVAGASARGESPAKVDGDAVEAMVESLTPRWAPLAQKMLFDFRTGKKVAELFSPLDDVIMGGVSSSQLVTRPEGGAAFCGNVSLKQNGGFCQVRCMMETPLDLTDFEGIVLQIRGDGRRYKLNLKNSTEPEFVFQIAFNTEEDRWSTVRLPFRDFVPVRRGQIVYGVGTNLYGSQLDPSNVLSLSLVISKIDVGGQKESSFIPGTFRLEIEWIAAYRPSLAKFVLLSSAGVTRPGWSEAKKRTYPFESSIPIVKLNPSNVLCEKLRGEQALSRSGIPFSIIRSTGLNEDHPSGKIEFSTGDTLVGRINRRDLAKVLVDTLNDPSSTYQTREVRSIPDSSPDPLSAGRDL